MFTFSLNSHKYAERNVNGIRIINSYLFPFLID